jgi:hypothetical protein
MNRGLDPEKKKGLILVALVALLLVCVFVSEKYRGACARDVVGVVGFTLLVLGFHVLLGREALAWNKYLYFCQLIVWIALIILFYLIARSECGRV